MHIFYIVKKIESFRNLLCNFLCNKCPMSLIMLCFMQWKLFSFINAFETLNFYSIFYDNYFFSFLDSCFPRLSLCLYNWKFYRYCKCKGNGRYFMRFSSIYFLKWYWLDFADLWQLLEILMTFISLFFIIAWRCRWIDAMHSSK